MADFRSVMVFSPDNSEQLLEKHTRKNLSCPHCGTRLPLLVVGWHGIKQTPEWIVSQISMSRSSWRMINKVGNVWDSTTLISEMNIKIVVLCFLHVSLDTRILLDFFWIKNSNKPCSNLGHYLKFKCISTTKSPIHHLIWRGNTSKSIKTPPTNFTCVF